MTNKPQNINKVLDDIERDMGALDEMDAVIEATLKELNKNLDESEKAAPSIEAAITNIEREGTAALLQDAKEQAEMLDEIITSQKQEEVEGDDEDGPSNKPISIDATDK